jgi:hypothetical protein
MKTVRNAILIAAVAALAALAAAAGASAAPHGKTLFRFVGKLDGKTATSVTVTVENGTRPALRLLLGQSQQQTFTTGDKTVFLTWSGGIPKQVSIDDLVVGDYVAVNVRSTRDASLNTVRGTAAGLVADRGATLNRPAKPLYLFRGTFVSAADGKVTIQVKGGNRRALRLLLGQAPVQSFSTGPDTIFLYWSHRIPTVITAADLKPGDRILIRIRAAARASLADVEATAAARVADREPKGEEQHQNAEA